MNTLHLVHGSPLIDPDAGGTERYVHAIASQTGAGVVAPDLRTGQTSQIPAPYPLWSVGIKSDERPIFKDTWLNPRFEAGFEMILDKTPPDLVHIHHFAHVGLNVASILRQRRIPYIVTLHDHHLMCVRGQLLNRKMERCEGPSKERCPQCISEHLAASKNLHKAANLAKVLGVRHIARRFFEKRAPSEKGIDSWLARNRSAREALGGAMKIISPSIHLAKRFQGYGFEVTVQDLPLLNPIERRPAPKDNKTRLLFVGSLIPSKGPQVLLEAMARLPDCSLSLWGPVLPYDGRPGWENEIRRKIDSTPNAQYMGSFSDKQRSSVYSEAHILIVPSIWEENSPLIVREGLTAGLHIIGTLGGGVGEIDPKATLIPHDDVDALCVAIKAKRKSSTKRRTDHKEWSIENHTRDLDAHYAEAMREIKG